MVFTIGELVAGELSPVVDELPVDAATGSGVPVFRPVKGDAATFN
jgi:hypothetical protein